MAKLKLRLHEGNTDRLIIVNLDTFTIGRLPECNLYLPFAGISRWHARFVKTPSGSWVVEDLGSKNGTKLNDIRVTYPQEIHDEDVVCLGDICMVIQLIDTSNSEETHLVAPQQRAIVRSAQELQQQWIHADGVGDVLANKDQAIARLKDLVDIAKNLSGAASIEEIFSQVQQVVFRYLESIDRLALLIDVNGSGKLELMNSAIRKPPSQIPEDGNWISRSICHKVFTEKVAVQTADAQRDWRFQGQDSILFKDIRSAMAVPLWDENKVVGVLYADAHLSSRHWASEGEEELSFFSALANLVASSVQRWLLVEKLKSEEMIRQRLERYHSPAVVQQLIALQALPNGRLPPTESEISILFADLVGFTALSERITPREIGLLLNAFFEEMLQEVFASGGTLDKYIGDCIMAFFGAPEPQADHAIRAVAAAKGMLTRLEHLNANEFWREPLQLRIAINSGKAMVGDVGSSQRVDYTALGATINLAARMEAICHPGECVISETTYKMLGKSPAFEHMGYYRFKGIARPIRVYHTQQTQQGS